MAKRILKFAQQDFKVCDWPLRLVSGGQSQTLKYTRPSWTFEPRPKWLLADKVLYEEMMTNDDNLESNLLTSSLLKIHSLYKFCRVQVAHVEPEI